jgi:competence protein ComEA
MRQLIFMLSLLWLFCSAALAAVNINTASQSELETLPGIGPSKAGAIIEYRSTSGAFTSIEQLDNVPGIGPATMSNLRPLVVLGDGDAPPAPLADPNGQTTAPAPTISPEDASGRVDVNTAGQSVLEGLPGIGPSKARAIIEYRSTNGPFASCDDLARVNGIGPATVSSLRDSCVAVVP